VRFELTVVLSRFRFGSETVSCATAELRTSTGHLTRRVGPMCRPGETVKASIQQASTSGPSGTLPSFDSPAGEFAPESGIGVSVRLAAGNSGYPRCPAHRHQIAPGLSGACRPRIGFDWHRIPPEHRLPWVGIPTKQKDSAMSTRTAEDSPGAKRTGGVEFCFLNATRRRRNEPGSALSHCSASPC